MYHKMFRKYIKKRNKPQIQVEDIEKAVEIVRKIEKKLREAAALFAINPSTAFYGAWGSVVVKALRYKSEGPGIVSRCRRCFFRGI